MIRGNPAMEQHRNVLFLGSLCLAFGLLALTATAVAQTALGQDSYVDQGWDWTSESRHLFYTEDQGSRIMPYAWAKALRQPDGRMFWQDSGSRYGFIPSGDSYFDNNGFPVGFFVVRDKKDAVLSMNCSACHTREIYVDGQEYRIDGGPAFVDFYGFTRDLFEAVNYTKSNKEAFEQFQTAVGTPPVKLKKELDDWYSVNALTLGRLPVLPWGVGRLDALSNIANRVTGAMIGSPPSFLIPENVADPNFPVRFPFLWNANRQDLTQWTGSSINGNSEYALIRNAGQLLGVWGMTHIRGNNFLVDNTTNYSGLQKLEELVNKIGPPTWPWAVDETKAARGGQLYEVYCSECHGIRPGAPRPPVYDTWYTPVLNVGTDPWYWFNLGRRTASSGLLTGLTIPGSGQTVDSEGAIALQLVTALNQLSLVQKFGSILFLPYPADRLPRIPGSYESRVLQGIWAAAPYLHNGSVVSLAELLKPASERKQVFWVGPAYDVNNVGLAEEQPPIGTFFDTSQIGNSNAGHEYGTDLSAELKEDLLEYLKGL